MNALPRESRWRRNWIFVFFCALATFLSGVTATLVVFNTSGYSSPESIQSARSPKSLLTARSLVQAKEDSSRVLSPAAGERPVIVRVNFRTMSAPSSQVVHHDDQPRYRSYLVKPGETLSRLDPEGWKHTCEINRQLGKIKKTDCTLTADAEIFLPVAVVRSLTLALDSHLQTTVSRPDNRKLSIEEQSRLAEIALRRFCDSLANEELPGCKKQGSTTMNQQQQITLASQGSAS
ncbi:MAG: hypothetical protein KBA91_01740 [Candidatus Moranbacteria bacterium]|jgi:hypothetical protein|nr:hypothetical protein [Candidatus Moranbacteria bacterium]